MNSVAVIILTFNEEIHIERALRSIAPIARELVIVDSYSTDRTLEICRAAGARVVQHPFVNQAKQFQWALDNVVIESEWIMRLDADEIIEADLAAEIADKLPSLPRDVTGINLNRKTIFQGRWIRHGGRYPLILLRMWRKGKARVEDRWMDEHILLTEGRAVTLKGGFADDNLNDLKYFTAKHNAYAQREAVEILMQRYELGRVGQSVGEQLSSRQASRKRAIKNFANRIPFEITSLVYFMLRCVAQLGFLDGREGLTYHVLQGFWYRYLVGARTVELDRKISKCNDKIARRTLLSELTGLDLDN